MLTPQIHRRGERRGRHLRQPVPIPFIRMHEIVSIGNVLRAYARPLSRRTKPISETFRRLPAAGRRFSGFSPLFPPRETDLQQILPPSRRTKAFFERFYRLPAAENRFSEIFSHFPPREGVFLRIYPISRRGKAFSESFDRFPAAGRRF